MIVRVPPNCIVTSRDTNVTLGKLVQPGERLLVAEGGGGHGVLRRRLLRRRLLRRAACPHFLRRPPGREVRSSKLLLASC